MTDYSQLTDDEMDIEIAKRQGWTDLVVYPVTDPFAGDPRKWGYILGTAPWGTKGYLLPRHSRDVDVALSLLADMTDAILYKTGDEWAVETFMGGAAGESPERVICLAWLEFTDSVRTPSTDKAESSSHAPLPVDADDSEPQLTEVQRDVWQADQQRAADDHRQFTDSDGGWMDGLD